MTALGVLRSDTKLLVFPLLSGIALLAVVISFALPFVFNESLRNLIDVDANAQGNQAAGKEILLVAILFAFYFVSYFVIIFFNSALVACTLIRFNGEQPRLSDGFGAAASRLPQIFAWALVSATVGVVLKIIENSSEKVGQFISGLLGLVWSVLTYFVVPVLVVEKLGPIAAVKRSAGIMRKTWGEGLVANFGVGLVMFVFFLLALIPAAIGIYLGGTMLIVGVATTVVLVLLVSLISTAAHTIVVAALYQYAAQDRVPQQFDADTLRGAFATK